ncbi:hypothetical protein BGZ67_010226, partial [Mortierella alpina]
MATVTEAYMGHVGNVLDMLSLDRPLDPLSLPFVSSTPLPLDFAAGEAPPLIHKVDVALQRVVQKMFLMEHELARHRRECKTHSTYYPGHPSSLVSSDLPLVPPILTPPVDSLSPPIAPATRWSEGTTTWGFMNDAATYPSPYSFLPQERPSLSSIHSLSDAASLSANSNSSSISDSLTSSAGVPIVQAASSSTSSAYSSSQSGLPATASSPAETSTSSSRSPPSQQSGFLAVGVSSSSSMPSSPDSFNSALSSFLPDSDSADVVPALSLSNNTASSMSDTVPCAACIHNCALVASAVAKGDLSARIRCENAACNNSALTKSINSMVSKLCTFTGEVIQVAALGVEGKFGAVATIADERGIWKEFVSHLNTMTNGHMNQVRAIAQVCTAVAHGDLSKMITIDVKGETLVLKNTINTMVEQLRSFSSEVTRVAHEVGTEGNLGGQAIVKGVDGTWKELTDNVNTMASNLTSQVRDIAHVSKAVARGDLSKKVSVAAKGEMMDLKHVINTMVDQLQEFATEVSRVSLEVGTEGKLGGQAVVKDVSGTWKELTDNVNLMAYNLTGQVRDIATVCKAVACGDLTKKVCVPVQGEILDLKETMNTMVDQLRTFAAEVTRVAREVGTEGKLGGQAEVEGVDGTWKELTDNVNTMAENLTAQVRDIANVSKAVARGDLSKKISVEVKGEMMDLKHTINIMVDQLQEFATEVSRVSLEVGTEGKLGGQAVVKDVSGTWKELTDNVNTMASNLTTQVRSIAEVTTAVACGDLSKTIDVEAQGEISEVKLTVNSMVEQLRTFAAEVTRVAREVGTEGRLGGQALVKGVDGTWKELTDNVNTMAENLTAQVRDIANVSKAVAKGDLSKKISVEVKGEMMDLKHTINTMVDQLQEFATEVSRVSLEVGTEGKLGGQAVVKDVSGTWKELTDNVNTMASNLTTQVRSIAEVTTAVACGDLSKTIDVQAQGEISEVKLTVNSMVEQLRTFAAEVTRVAREVGTEGKLGGQAHVKGVDGTWKELTDNVNTMAANLTAQVRDIASVSKAVARGDLSQKISVEVKGEMGDLKHTINTMVVQLQEFATEVSRVSLEVGTEGKLGGQAVVKDVSGTWKELTDNVNTMASNLTTQ